MLIADEPETVNLPLGLHFDFQTSHLYHCNKKEKYFSHKPVFIINFIQPGSCIKHN